MGLLLSAESVAEKVLGQIASWIVCRTADTAFLKLFTDGGVKFEQVSN
ncbi:MAG: hypothetical protein Q4G49_17480 [Paracoccus sp. (in: a-proteobacteria)]|nr:hypothetical protein [Paracoccus sp. (in: a-proteobacteria)]